MYVMYIIYNIMYIMYIMYILYIIVLYPYLFQMLLYIRGPEELNYSSELECSHVCMVSDV